MNSSEEGPEERKEEKPPDKQSVSEYVSWWGRVRFLRFANRFLCGFRARFDSIVKPHSGYVGSPTRCTDLESRFPPVRKVVARKCHHEFSSVMAIDCDWERVVAKSWSYVSFLSIPPRPECADEPTRWSEQKDLSHRLCVACSTTKLDDDPHDLAATLSGDFSSSPNLEWNVPSKPVQSELKYDEPKRNNCNSPAHYLEQGVSLHFGYKQLHPMSLAGPAPATQPSGSHSA